MENKIVKIENNQDELHTIEDMVAGLDSAVVTYGIDQDHNVHKVVTLFCRTPMSIDDFENYSASHNRILAENTKIALTKSWDYSIKDKKVKRYQREYYKILLRSLIGFVKDKFTQDVRYMYEHK